MHIYGYLDIIIMQTNKLIPGYNNYIEIVLYPEYPVFWGAYCGSKE
jgi:hypothetical protein